MEVKAEVVGRSEALFHTAGWISEGVADEGQRWGDSAVLERTAQAEPVSEQVLGGQNQLEGGSRQGACAGRGPPANLGAGYGRRANGKQDGNKDEHPGAWAGEPEDCGRSFPAPVLRPEQR